MGLVQLVMVVMSSAQLALTSPQTKRSADDSAMCPAGRFKSGPECQPCPAGSFTTDWNLEDSCHRCFGDCRPDLHLKVVRSCTSTSDVKCVCEVGFKCTEIDPDTGNCKSCVEIQRTTTDGDEALTSPSIEYYHTDSGGRWRHLYPVPPTPTADVKSNNLAAILSPVVVVGCVALMVLLCFRQPGHETCFKRAIAELFNERRRVSASCKSKDSSLRIPKDSFRAKQQPAALAEANLGPVYVQNPGTVIFSVLSQFTGQVGATIESGKATERAGSEDEEERESPVCHPTSSPVEHLSEEEEKTGEMENIFFPSQEQGKDCHVSTEEG